MRQTDVIPEATQTAKKQLAAAGVTLGETYPTRVAVDVVRMRHGVGEVRAGEVARAAAEAAAAGVREDAVAQVDGLRLDVAVRPRRPALAQLEQRPRLLQARERATRLAHAEASAPC